MTSLKSYKVCKYYWHKLPQDGPDHRSVRHCDEYFICVINCFTRAVLKCYADLIIEVNKIKSKGTVLDPSIKFKTISAQLKGINEEKV